MIPCRCGKYSGRMTSMHGDPPKLLKVCNNCGRQPDDQSRAFKICTCFTCGYQWQQGKDGSHSCTSNMAKKIQELEAEIKTLRTAQKAP